MKAPHPTKNRKSEKVSIPPTKLSGKDVYREALAALSQRPSRTILTMLGSVLGVGAFVAVIGLSATASGQISNDFSVLKATEVTVTDAAPPGPNQTSYSFPAGADQIMDHLNGVTAAGQTWTVPGGATDITTTLDPRISQTQVTFDAASPGYFQAAQASLQSGRLFNAFDENHQLHDVVLGSSVANGLGISSVSQSSIVFLYGTRYDVVGIVSGATRAPDVVSTVFIPASTALALYGDPESSNPATMLVGTRLGAANLIAKQAPTALRPDDPELLRATPPITDFSLQKNVTTSLTTLFLILAAITLVIGAIGIANTTLVSVLERTPEIGLRRTLGARPRDIWSQILAETAALGTLGGLIGTAFAVAIVVIASITASWTALLSPTLTLTAPFLGTLIGVLAGIYPAGQAAKIQPIEALRR